MSEVGLLGQLGVVSAGAPEWLELVLSGLVGLAICEAAYLVLSVRSVQRSRAGHARSSHQRSPLHPIVVGLLIASAAAGIAYLVFAFPGREQHLGHEVDDRFTLLTNLLKGLALVLVAGATASILAAVLMRPASVRRPVRRAAQRIAGWQDSADNLWWHELTRPIRACGSAVLWLTDSSLRIQTFTGDVTNMDAAAISGAMAGLLPEIGSPTRIGQAVPLDPRLETVPFAATHVAEDIEKALSDAPYGKAAAALVSLLDRVLPRERLRVAGILLDSPQRGPGLTVTIARINGVTIGSEIIWSSDFDPAILSSDKNIQSTISTTLTLALAGAVWVAVTLAKDGGQRDLKDTLGTASWQSYALVRVGLQGAATRPPRITQAIYARAVEADAESLPDGDHGNLAARLNLALIKLRRDDFSFGALYTSGVRELKKLSSIVSKNDGRTVKRKTGDQLDPLRLSIDFNHGVALINAYHAGRKRSRGLRKIHANVRQLILELEDRLERLDDRPESARSDERSVLAQFEAPMIGLWASLDLLVRLGDGESYADIPKGEPLATLKAELDTGSLHHARVVKRLEDRRLDSRTRYNLACYWASRHCYKQALAHLQASHETMTVGFDASKDPALRRLRLQHPKQFRAVMKDLQATQ